MDDDGWGRAARRASTSPIFRVRRPKGGPTQHGPAHHVNGLIPLLCEKKEKREGKKEDGLKP
jgi:hypothetical protein